MSLKKRIVFWILTVFLASVVTFVLAEVSVLLLYGSQVRFPRHVVAAEFGVRINEPNAIYRHRSKDINVGFRINGQGMRAERDYGYEKPEGVIRIVSLGDSFTVGYEVEVEETFSLVLEKELRKLGYNIEVLNTGVSGYSNAEACVYLERELLKYDPDIVILSFFSNDLVDNVRSNLFRLVNDQLVEADASYVPGGAVGNFLNRNFFLSFLSEHSHAFARAKERATAMFKRRIESNAEQAIGVAVEETTDEDP